MDQQVITKSGLSTDDYQHEPIKQLSIFSFKQA